MGSRVVQSERLPVACEDDIVVVRRRVRSLAQEKGFGTFAVAAITTAASELARNVWTHAGQGYVDLEVLLDSDRAGLRLRFEDQGPGIRDVDRALAGGYSTAKSLGLGLSGSRRLVDEFTLDSEPGAGTRVTVLKWVRL